MTEPQLAFHSNEFDSYFDESFQYGKMSKAELLVRLGVKGVWQNWLPEPKVKSKFFGQVRTAGYVHRLPSGSPECESDNVTRSKKRDEGIENLVNLANLLFLK
jgi:hypothetical protein